MYYFISHSYCQSGSDKSENKNKNTKKEIKQNKKIPKISAEVFKIIFIALFALGVKNVLNQKFQKQKFNELRPCSYNFLIAYLCEFSLVNRKVDNLVKAREDSTRMRKLININRRMVFKQ